MANPNDSEKFVGAVILCNTYPGLGSAHKLCHFCHSPWSGLSCRCTAGCRVRNGLLSIQSQSNKQGNCAASLKSFYLQASSSTQPPSQYRSNNSQQSSNWPKSVHKECIRLILRSPQLRIASLHDEFHDPSNDRSPSREPRRRIHRNSILRRIALWPQIWSPNEARIHDGRDDADGSGFLLLSLPAGRANPTKDEGVYSVGADAEDDHCELCIC